MSELKGAKMEGSKVPAEEIKNPDLETKSSGKRAVSGLKGCARSARRQSS